MDLWDIVEAGYAKPADWSNIEGEKRMRRKAEQHQNCKALMELRRGITFDIFHLIKNCITAFDVWRELNASFENENCKLDCNEMNSNLQDYEFVNDDFMGKEDEPLSYEVFCEQPCEYVYLQEETWNVYEKNLQRRGVYVSQGRGGKRGFALVEAKMM